MESEKKSAPSTVTSLAEFRDRTAERKEAAVDQAEQQTVDRMQHHLQCVAKSYFLLSPDETEAALAELKATLQRMSIADVEALTEPAILKFFEGWCLRRFAADAAPPPPAAS